MKTIILCFSIVIFWGIRASGIAHDDCYLRAGDKIYFGEDIKIGPVHTRIIFTDGTSVKVDNHDVATYRHHNQMFMRLPVICEKNDTLCYAMMKYITTRDGISIFQFCCKHDDDVFFEYKDGKFYRRLNASEAKTELAQMGIKTKDS